MQLDLAQFNAGETSEAYELVKQLSLRVDHLALINLALWQLLQEKVGLTEAELDERIAKLDSADGKADDRATPAVVHNCPHCGRPLSLRFHRCLYCEYQEPVSGFAAVVR